MACQSDGAPGPSDVGADGSPSDASSVDTGADASDDVSADADADADAELDAAADVPVDGTIDAAADASSPDVSDVADAAETGPDAFDWSPALAPLGGDATVETVDARTFSTLIDHLPLESFAQASRGRELFVADWEIAPSTRPILDGLGPHFHVTSCVACHPGTGRPVSYRDDGSVAAGVLFRLSHEGAGDPVYGTQLQPAAIGALAPEASVRWYADEPADVRWIPVGTSFVAFEQMSQGPLHADTRVSPRASPQIVGMGHLDLVPDAEILAWADPDDADGDGISGRPNWLGEGEARRLGRYGWKANMPDLRTQVAAAFRGDLGLTSPVFPTDDCTPAQTGCLAQPSGGDPEVTDEGIDEVVSYLEHLGVPARDGSFRDVQEGYSVFVQVGCGSCHRPTMTTGPHATVSVLSEQAIHPFTDMLLHDMGDELADGVPDGGASGSEWRTAPLWGIGRVSRDPAARFLHDGRAMTLDEAIRWHGGEATGSRTAYSALASGDRALLLAFLESL